MQRIVRICIAIVLLKAASCLAPPGEVYAAETSLADRLLQQAGVAQGLCVQLDGEDGRLATDLGKHASLVVHLLAAEEATAALARRQVEAAGRHGRVSVGVASVANTKVGAPPTLPYADGLANLVIAPTLPASPRAVEQLTEAIRILAPTGVALIGGVKDGEALARLQQAAKAAGIEDAKVVEIDGRWLRLVKPRPAGVDDWTHPNHSAGGNRVSQDTLAGPPGQLRWIDGPPWATTADGPGAVLSSNGRLYYMFDEAPDGKPSRNWPAIYARDAHNGLLIWKRPITGFTPLCFVATPERILTVVENKGNLLGLDPATGETAFHYEAATFPDWVVYHDGNLFTAAGNRSARRLMCLNASTGEVKWRSDLSIRSSGALPNFIVSGNLGYYLDWEGRKLGCLTLASGEIKWEQDISRFLNGLKWRYGLCSHGHGQLIVGEGMQGEGIHAFRDSDGQHQWSHGYRLVYSGRPSRHKGSTYDGGFFIDGLYWTHVGVAPDAKGSIRGAEAWEGLDPATGNVQRRFAYDEGVIVGDSCHRAQATVNFFMGGHTRFVSTKTGQYVPRSYGIHNSCRFGMLPANGLTYTWSQYTNTYVRGLMGLTPASATPPYETAAADRLAQGPAYDKVATGSSNEAPRQPSAHPWRQFGADATRSAASQSNRSATRPAPRWQVDLGSDTTPAVAADGLTVVAQPADSRVVALRSDTGEVAWKYLAGGRISSPPTLHDGLCLFGCADGWAYCLSARDGELVWRYQAARHDRLIVGRSRLESPWPVDGGVLIEGGLACFAAGRHGTLDGGVDVYAVRPRTGELVWTRRIDESPVISLLASGGKTLSLGGKTSFAIETGEPASRPNYGEGVYRADQIDLTQRIGVKNNDSRMQPQLTVDAAAVIRDGDTILVAGRAGAEPPALRWLTQRNAIQLIPTIHHPSDPPAESFVWAFSLADGRLLWTQPLTAAPVFDGLTIADGKLYVATLDHRLHCFASDQPPRDK